MVFVNVPKLHALVGVLAATVAIPLGCSNDDFEGCEASRTCKPDDTGGSSGKGGTNGGGEAGDTDTGGSSGSGTSGASGADDGGHGGAGDDTTRPTVVSITPDDGATEVERDIEITVTLSEPIDAASVTRQSATLEGPDGDVTGTLSVDGAVITFVAEKPLYLLGDYTFTLADTVADLAGNTLADAASVGFQVRDGRWGAPTYPFGTTVARAVRKLQRNALGDVVVGMEPLPNNDSVYGATYRAAENKWELATALRTMAGVQYYAFDAAIDRAGRAVVSWGGYNTAGYGWSRSTDEGGWASAGTLSGFATLAITSDDQATALWFDASSNELMTATKDLSNGSDAPSAPLSLAATIPTLQSIASLERLALVTVESNGGADELRVRWKDGSSWGAFEPLASAPEIRSLVSDADDLGNIILVWRDDDEIRSRIYDRAKDEWTREALVGTATSDAVVGSVDITGGNAIVEFNTFDPDPGAWVAVYESGIGWVEDSVVRLDGAWTGGSVGVAIDTAGNGLAAWRPEFRFRRYIAGIGWQARSLLDDVDGNEFSIWSVADPDGTVLVVTNGEVSHVPVAVRFE